MTATPAAAGTAAQLLAENACSPGCLLARTARCSCPCGGRLHGLLSATPVPAPDSGQETS